jgi:RNA polymerase sigma-70 factor (ECF subfamily)
MLNVSQIDGLLIDRIRRGDEGAWDELIARFEGRLLAFAESRLRRRASAEDVVQETFIGFLTSLPNFDGKRSIESYLFAICAYKLTDFLRREGRRPALPLSSAGSSEGDWEIAGSLRGASSIAQSGERRGLEEAALVEAMSEQVERWKERGDWEKLKCMELLFVRGWANKEVATALSISEQQVANFKFDFLARMRTLVKKQELNADIFPELYES